MYRIKALSEKGRYYLNRNLTELLRDAHDNVLVEARQVRFVAHRLEDARLVLDRDFEVTG